MRRRVVLAALAACAAAPAGAQAQVLPPSLTVDTRYAFGGFSEFDVDQDALPGPTDTAAAAAADPARGRLYAVGTTGDRLGLDPSRVVVVARTTAGALDRSFAGSGSLALPVGLGAARGADVAVLGDGRLRVLATVDAGTADADLALIGLLPDGTPDPAFGTDGVVRFGDAAVPETAARLDVDAAGRFAVTGRSGAGATADTLVAVREADGSAAAFGTDGLVVTDRAAGQADGGADVAWTGTGVAVLAQLGEPPVPGTPTYPGSAGSPAGAELLALTPAGQPDTAFSTDGEALLEPGGTAVVAGGLEVAAGALWATGASVVDADRDAFLARVALDGSGAQARRFDLRGALFPADRQVASTGLDLTLLPGDPDTLVVGGETATDAGAKPSAAAFNDLSRPVAELQVTDLVVPIEGQGRVVGVAAGGGGEVAATAALADYSTETSSGTEDTSIGMGRLLVDDEKRCDLSLVVAGPLELRLSGRNPGTVGLRVTNVGQRPCAGTVTPSAPFASAPAVVETGRLAPRQSVTLTPTLTYASAALPETARTTFTLAAPGDVALGDNQATLGVRFAFCDVGVRAFRAPSLLSSEGDTLLTLSMRNRGTATCRVSPTVLSAPGVRLASGGRYDVPAGQSATDEVRMRLARTARPGARVSLTLRVPTARDIATADNTTRVRATVVRPGDTRLRVARDRRSVTGRATRGLAPGQSGRSLRVRRVEVAVRRLGKGCVWLVNARRGRFGPGGTTGKRPCDAPVWLKARGTSRWTFALPRRLAAGRYLVQSRVVLRNGIAESRFSRSDGNTAQVRVR